MTIYRTLDLELDSERQSICREGIPLSLRPKTFRLLLFFLANPGQTLSKHQLLAHVWGDVQVEEQTLFQSISEVRKLCGDKTVIQNYPQKGYAWTPTVVQRHAAPLSLNLLVKFKKTWLKAGVFGGLCAVLLTIVLGRLYHINQAVQLDPGSIIVLPVESSRQHSWVSIGAMDLLIKHLREGGIRGGNSVQPILPAEDVLTVLNRVSLNEQLAGQDASQAKSMSSILNVSNASSIIELEVIERAEQYHFKYGIHTKRSTRSGVVSAPTIGEGVTEVAKVIASNLGGNASAITPIRPTFQYTDSVTKGLQYLRAGNYEKAKSYLMSAAVRAPENSFVRRLLAESYYYEGDYDAADKLLTKTIQDANKKGAPISMQAASQNGHLNTKAEKFKQLLWAEEVPRLAYWMALNHFAQGDLVEAKRYANYSIGLAQKVNDWLYHAYANELMASILLEQNKLQASEQALLTALIGHSKVNCPVGQSKIVLALADLALRTKQSDKAKKYLIQAEHLARSANLSQQRIVALIPTAGPHQRPSQNDLAKDTQHQAATLVGEESVLNPLVEPGGGVLVD